MKQTKQWVSLVEPLDVLAGAAVVASILAVKGTLSPDGGYLLVAASIILLVTGFAGFGAVKYRRRDGVKGSGRVGA